MSAPFPLQHSRIDRDTPWPRPLLKNLWRPSTRALAARRLLGRGGPLTVPRRRGRLRAQPVLHAGLTPPVVAP